MIKRWCGAWIVSSLPPGSGRAGWGEQPDGEAALACTPPQPSPVKGEETLQSSPGTLGADQYRSSPARG
jgi:hypothetical protein